MLFRSLIRKYIYPLDSHNKFILEKFPETIDQLNLLEKICCNVSKEFYFSSNKEANTEKLGLSTIETVMCKSNRLINLQKFEPENLEQYYGNNLVYVIIVGAAQSGKTAVAKVIEKSGYTLLDALNITEEIKKKLATEENPAENINVSLEQLLEELKNRIMNRTNRKEKFVLDNFSLEDSSAIEKIVSMIGPPAFFIELQCNLIVLKERYKKKNELQELTEDQNAELEKASETYGEILKAFAPIKESTFTQSFQISSEISEARTSQELKVIFEPKIILLTHEQSINIDITLRNLSIKHGFIYIPLLEIIKEEILTDTLIGKELKQTRKMKKLDEESPDFEFYPMHYEINLLIQLVRNIINKLRTTQKYVLIDGLLKSNKLKDDNEKLEFRAIDELLTIEKEVGETQTVIRLSHEPYEDVADDRIAERIPVEEKVEEKKEEKKNEEGEEGEAEPEAPPPEEDEEGKPLKPKFNPLEFAWTNTEGKPRNLGQFFLAWKNCTSKNIDQYQDHGDSIEVTLDSLIESLIVGELSKSPIYVQIKIS